MATWFTFDSTYSARMNNPHRPLLLIAGLLGLSAVALGAFGAHALEEVFAASEGGKAGQWWNTAAHYHLIHALAAGLASMLVSSRGRLALSAGFCFAAGTLIFAGTLYAMALGAPRVLGAVTPIGGLTLMVGWVLLAASAAKRVETVG